MARIEMKINKGYLCYGKINFNGNICRIAVILAVTVLSLYQELSAEEKLGGKTSILASGRKTAYVITVMPDDLVANTSAKELAQYLKAVTGTEFPIVKPAENLSPIIAVGPGAAKTLLPDLDLSFAKLGNDGIVMKNSGENLILTGAETAKRGTLYAVYEFLESRIGIRWWTSSETYIPKREILPVPEMDTVYVPRFIYRDAFYCDMFNGVFAARCKCNGHAEKIAPEYGGNCRVLGWCHTFYQLLPPDKYFKEHPEWYSEKGGKRTFDGARGQLCLSNGEMRKELTKNALEWLRKNPDAGMISISQNDACSIANGCDCPKCLELARREASPSGPLIQFVNKVAEDIEKEFPNVYVETLAYGYTKKPPLTMKPRQNVLVRLCLYPTSFSEPLSMNKECDENIKAWSTIAPHLFIWDYVACYRNFLQPFPNLYTLDTNIRYFAEHNAIGMFEQGDNGSDVGDFVQLRAWVIAHLLWNPNLDGKTLIKEFMDGYYGPAAKPLQEYLGLVHNAAAQFDSGRKPAQGTPWFKFDDMKKANEIFDNAEALVKDDPVLSRRVRRARMPLDYTWIREYNELRFRMKTEDRAFQKPSLSDMAALCDKFLLSVGEFKLDEKKYTEQLKFKDMIPGLPRRFRSVSPKEVAGMAEDDWINVPVSDCRFWKMGTLVNWVNDPEASSGRAVRMPGNHTEWAVQYAVPPFLPPVRCYAVIRCDIETGTPGTGKAFISGLYNDEMKKGNSITDTVEHIADGKYRTYELGVCSFNNGYVWVAPTNNPEVKAVYVDRFFFVRESKLK